MTYQPHQSEDLSLKTAPPPTIPADVGRLLQAAKAVAYSNGFDAALPDKMEALRAAITELKQYLPAQEQGEKERI
jgi:hypothetical protein